MKYFASFYRKYLYLDFCLPELISICEMLKVKLDYDKDFSGDLIMDPIVGIDIEGLDNSDIAQKIIDRSVLTKYIVKIYSTGSTFDQLVADLDKEEFLKESLSEQSFKFDVNACGRVMSEKEKLSVMEKFGCLNFKGKVNIKNAERTFVVLDNHKRGVKYFGRMIAGKEGNYNLLIEDDSRYYSKYNLQARKYLGPTSTDNVLAFLMCNMARIQNHDYVLDPFVGTGSLLIPPSHFGAVTTGCDIDMRVLKGYSVGYTKPTMKKVSEEEEHTNIYTNFLHYDLPCPQILRSDINHPCFKNRGFFDSIICDPPYGYRAISRKTGMKEEKKEKRQKRLTEKYGNLLKNNQDNLDKRDEKDSNDETTNKNIEEPIDINTCKERHRVFTYNGKNETFIFSPLKQCSVESIFENLLNLGDSCLKEGGLLVCLYPTEKPKEQDPMTEFTFTFPQHENFDLLFKVENPYSELKSRWCLVFQKRTMSSI